MKLFTSRGDLDALKVVISSLEASSGNGKSDWAPDMVVTDDVTDKHCVSFSYFLDRLKNYYSLQLQTFNFNNNWFKVIIKTMLKIP